MIGHIEPQCTLCLPRELQNIVILSSVLSRTGSLWGEGGGEPYVVYTYT